MRVHAAKALSAEEEPELQVLMECVGRDNWMKEDEGRERKKKRRRMMMTKMMMMMMMRMMNSLMMKS